ncbi:DUF305 domain-containing protein [Ornithinimicrobium sufpigmenti]|uniref:DUF305 domain-containing protein n=1 Tax=Ornithinimicrobium sufpigmenti TaxID=2508882 RepID=UPI0010361C6D|nr:MULTISPECIES: DUF305 domain-containing protein [unclassified Ornithinimicrobium]
MTEHDAEQPATAQDGQGPAPAPAAPRDRWRTFGAPALAAVTVLALSLGVLLGWLTFGERTPGDDSVDAGFARDMSEHHAQAIEMSFLVLERTDDHAVGRLAIDIANNQATERGMMMTWLQSWGLPFASPDGERMVWMEHDHHAAEALPPGVPMAGMASPVEIQELTDAEGDEAEILYLQLMTTHHIAGVEMAEDALRNADSPQVRAAAQRMVNAQFGEVTLMKDMLEERDSQAREDIDAWVASQQGSVTDDSEDQGEQGDQVDHDGH